MVRNHMQHFGLKTLVLLAFLAIFPIAYDLTPALQVLQPESPSFLLLKYVPVILSLTAAGLALRLHQIKIVLLSILIMLVYQLQMEMGVPLFVHAEDLMVTISVSIPLSVCLLLLLEESRVISRSGILKILLCFLPTALPLLVSYFDIADIGRLLRWTPLPIVQSKGVSHFAALPLLALLIESLLFKERITKSVLAVFSFFLIPFYYSLYQLHTRPDIICVVYSCAALMMVYLVIRQFWLNSYIDDLTEIPNRRALDEHLKFLPKRWCVAMVDVDHFKKFNDRYGHQAGDHVLRMVAATLAKAPHGQVYRYGGEEFTILYKGHDLYEVAEYVDDLVDTISRRHFTIRRPTKERKRTSAKDRGRKPVAPEKRVKVTISIGVTERKDEDRTPQLAIERADKGLYRAKRKGRNCAVVVE